MKLPFISILSFSLINTISMASDGSSSLRGYSGIECPKIPASISTVLQDLSALKNQIVNSEQCKKIEYQMGELESLLSSGEREKFLEIINSKERSILSSSDTEALRKYSENVSQYALKVMQLLQGNANCFPDDSKKNSLSTVTSIVYEATSLLGKVAGPYGVPITIGGNILVGILKGIQNNREQQAGFDFEKSQDRQEYTQQLCVFHNYRQELDTILYPNQRLTQMKRMHSYLVNKIREIEDNCSECKDILAAARKGRKERDVNLIATIDKKYTIPLVSLGLEAIDNSIWAKNEIDRLTIISKEKQRSIGPQEILQLKKDLEYFFFEREAPHFLFSQFEMAAKASAQFQSYTSRWVNTVLKEIPGEYLKELGPVNDTLTGKFAFIESVLSNKNIFLDDNLKAYIYSSRNRSADYLSMTHSSLGVIKEYCSFFQKTDALLSSKLLAQCSLENIDNQESTLVSFADYQQLIRAPRAAGENMVVTAGSNPPTLRTPLPPPAPPSASPASNKNTPTTVVGTLASNFNTNWVENFENEETQWSAIPNKFTPNSDDK